MSARKIVAKRSDLKRRVAALKESGRTVVFANGCFDLLHVGHVRYLEGAKAEGDVLVVGVNSDASWAKLGKDRPLVTLQAERAEIVAALECVDLVHVFDEPTVDALWREILPDVHAKGSDYTPETVPERETVLATGGRIAIVGDPKDHSTTDIVRRLAREIGR